MTTLTATATRIRKTKNERITYGDYEVRKSVEIGKYNFIALFFLGDNEKPYIGASRTRDAAGKWSPFPANKEVYPPKKSDDDHTKALFHNRMRDYRAKYGTEKVIRRNGFTYYRFAVPFTRTVVKLARS